MTPAQDGNTAPAPESEQSGSFLDGRRILLVVTGGIAAYKSCQLTRDIIRAGGSVTVVMTAAACRFVTPLSFATLSGKPVLSDMFPAEAPAEPIHLKTAQAAELMVVAPASADFIGKAALGLADDLASTVALAFQGRMLMAPAMNTSMWRNPAVQSNVGLLRERGVQFAGPAEGDMAGIHEQPGAGRMSEPGEILAKIEELLCGDRTYEGRRVVVTSGPTREPIDPVRFISNHSSGRMGDAVARAAALKGAQVTLIRGRGASCEPPPGMEIVTTDTASEMADAVKRSFPDCDLLIMAAAVADFTAESVSPSKLKKSDGLPRIPWRKTEDILKWAGQNKQKQVVVGFALETENHLAEARRKLTGKRADLIVLNDPTRDGSGFGSFTTQLTLIPASGDVVELPLLSKSAAAGRLMEAVLPLLPKR